MSCVQTPKTTVQTLTIRQKQKRQHNETDSMLKTIKDKICP